MGSRGPSVGPRCFSGGPGGFERPSLRSRRCQEAFPHFRDRLGGPLEGSGGVGRPFWRFVWGLEALPEVRVGL